MSSRSASFKSKPIVLSINAIYERFIDMHCTRAVETTTAVYSLLVCHNDIDSVY